MGIYCAGQHIKIGFTSDFYPSRANTEHLLGQALSRVLLLFL